MSGVTGTDGIDVTNVGLGPRFPAGLFAVHNNVDGKDPVEVSRYEDLGLSVDTTYWDPRRGSTVAMEPAPPAGLMLRVEYPRDGGVPTLVCTLPDARPAALEVFDVAGRRVESRSIASLGPGTHRLALAQGTALRAGLYLVRLAQGLASQGAKAFVMR